MPTDPNFTAALLAFDAVANAGDLFPTVAPAAAELVVPDPYAFAMACALNRGVKADTFRQFPRSARYISDAPKTIEDLTRIVMRECEGDASRIWTGKARRRRQPHISLSTALRRLI